jgi:hypothetical protein
MYPPVPNTVKKFELTGLLLRQVQFVGHIGCNRQSKRILRRRVGPSRFQENPPLRQRNREIGRNRH